LPVCAKPGFAYHPRRNDANGGTGWGDAKEHLWAAVSLITGPVFSETVIKLKANTTNPYGGDDGNATPSISFENMLSFVHAGDYVRMHKGKHSGIFLFWEEWGASFARFRTIEGNWGNRVSIESRTITTKEALSADIHWLPKWPLIRDGRYDGFGSVRKVTAEPI
jgi:hypothetical protein